MIRLFLAAAALTSTACGALDDFETTIEDEATIPGTFNAQTPSPLNFGGSFSSLDLSANREFSNQGVGPDDVDAIFVKAVHVESTEPMRDRLDVLLESIDLAVSSPGIAEKSVASKSQFPAAPAVDLDVVPDLNLKPYATAESMTMGATISLKQKPTFTTTLRVTVTLAIDINLLGT